jgi:hypothetical protein
MLEVGRKERSSREPEHYFLQIDSRTEIIDPLSRDEISETSPLCRCHVRRGLQQPWPLRASYAASRQN